MMTVHTADQRFRSDEAAAFPNQGMALNRVVAQQDLWGIHARNGHFPLEPPCFLVDLAALWGIMPVKRNQSLILQQL